MLFYSEFNDSSDGSPSGTTIRRGGRIFQSARRGPIRRLSFNLITRGRGWARSEPAIVMNKKEHKDGSPVASRTGNRSPSGAVREINRDREPAAINPPIRLSLRRSPSLPLSHRSNPISPSDSRAWDRPAWFRSPPRVSDSPFRRPRFSLPIHSIDHVPNRVGGR